MNRTINLAMITILILILALGSLVHDIRFEFNKVDFKWIEMDFNQLQ